MRAAVFGFPIEVRADFFLMLLGWAALMAGSWPVWSIATWCGVVVGALLVHELGHALAARAFRLPVRGIRLHALGGDVTHGAGSSAQQLVIALAGPGAGIAAGGVALLLAAIVGGGGPIGLVVEQILFATWGWSLLNLLPIRPLDGGNALLELLNLGGRPSSALTTTHRVGLGVGTALVVGAAASGAVYLVALGALLTYGNYAALRSRRGRG
jgi:stage IV sporulation protein FB